MSFLGFELVLFKALFPYFNTIGKIRQSIRPISVYEAVKNGLNTAVETLTRS